MADEKKPVVASKTTVTNTKANLHYSGDLRLLPGVETEANAAQIAFIEKHEAHLLKSGALVIKK